MTMGAYVVPLASAVVGAVAGVGGALLTTSRQRSLAHEQRIEMIYADFLAAVNDFALLRVELVLEPGSGRFLEASRQLRAKHGLLLLIANRATRDVANRWVSHVRSEDFEECIRMGRPSAMDEYQNACLTAMREHLRRGDPIA
jgi:hypothetical protein